MECSSTPSSAAQVSWLEFYQKCSQTGLQKIMRETARVPPFEPAPSRNRWPAPSHETTHPNTGRLGFLVCGTRLSVGWKTGVREGWVGDRCDINPQRSKGNLSHGHWQAKGTASFSKAGSKKGQDKNRKTSKVEPRVRAACKLLQGNGKMKGPNSNWRPPCCNLAI